jgi:hypothetical protein
MFNLNRLSGCSRVRRGKWSDSGAARMSTAERSRSIHSNRGPRGRNASWMSAYHTVSGHKSKREHQKARFFRVSNSPTTTNEASWSTTSTLGEVSPNQRSRAVGAYDHGIKVPAIVRLEKLTDSTCRSIIQNTSHQTSCITLTRKGAPSVLTPGDHRLIRRAIVVNPKIIAQQLFVQCAPHSKKTIY